jgi:protein-disulfide isomerase
VPEPRLTKDQRRAAAQEAARIQREKQKRKERRTRIFLIVGSTLAIIGVFAIVGVVLINANKPAGPGPANMASDGILFVGSDDGVEVVESDPIPADGTPTATDTDALEPGVHIVTYIDYRCPFCNEFEAANAATIQSLVEAGIASLEVHPISILDRVSLGSKYSTRAASAAGCVATYAPDQFLDVNAALFAAQPAENTSGLTNAELADVVAGAGVTDEKVASCIRDETYTSWVTAASTRALADPDLQDADGNFGTPRVTVNGVIYDGQPGDATAFQAFLTQAAIAADAEDGETPTPTPTPTTPAG